jgi:hypothetical protein
MATANFTQHTDIDIEMNEGDSLTATNAKFTDDDSTDYTGYASGTCLIKNSIDDADADAVITLTTANSKLVLANGFINFDTDASDTDGKAGVYYYAVKIYTATDEYTILKGTWTIHQRRVN